MATIGFIGSGNMAEAIIKGVISSGLYRPEDIFVSDISDERLEYMKSEHQVVIAEGNGDLVENCDAIVLSVKPQIMRDVLDAIRGKISDQKLIMSIAAGVTVSKITDLLGDIPVVRVMPNTPALVGEGATAVYANDKAQAKLNVALDLFKSVGRVVEVAKEELIDAVTALSGSGPAYYFLMMEEMIRAAQEIGLDHKTAKMLTLQTAMGAAKLALEADAKGETPDVLRRKVTSPGGTTEAALKVFNEDQFGAIVLLAMQRAKERSFELS